MVKAMDVNKIKAIQGKKEIQKKVRLRKNASQKSMLDIDINIVNMLKEQGIDLQWVTDSILGQPAPQSRMLFEVNCWEPVTPDMFDGIFEGMFTRVGHQGEINYEGLVLMWRPLELSIESRTEENAARIGAMEAQKNMVMNGVIPGLSPSFDANHPTAISRNTFRREVKPPMDVPSE